MKPGLKNTVSPRPFRRPLRSAFSSADVSLYAGLVGEVYAMLALALALVLVLALVLSESRARTKLLLVLVLVLPGSEGRGRDCVVASPGGAAVVDWKVVVLVAVAPGAEVAVFVVVGTVLMSGSVCLRGEDGEMPDCCMISLIVVEAGDVLERWSRSVVFVVKNG
jgi:hypothetical protein